MDIELLQTKDLLPYAKNARKHSQKQIDLLAKNIKRFGFTTPVLIDDNNEVIAGHGRLLALAQLNVAEVPTVRLKGLSEKNVKALRLADNKLAEMGEWDIDLAIGDLKELDTELFELTGFDRDLLVETSKKDDALPTEVPARAQLGDIWLLGKHRVMCGDSTKGADVALLMNGAKADLSFTSPPYNVGHNLGYEGKESKYAHSDDNIARYKDLIFASTALSLDNAKDVFVNLQLLANNKKEVLIWLAELSDNFKDIFFWKKKTAQPAMAANVANSQVELILLFGKGNTTRSWGNKRFRGTFSNHIETQSAGAENENAATHNATFPVELPLDFITQGYEEESLVLDLFLGTGTTLIAAEKSNRICYGMELDPKYVDLVLKRWEDFSGQKAIKSTE